ncbi:MAG TPA: TetR/AcrR family transcriptional regulator [Acidimicrobiales bacterium]|nr:TetR/AcrR family transcriptional regulator [Acidimicrobiales bacterium]
MSQEVSAAATGDGEAKVDGRHARRAANREAILAALAALHREGDLSPSTTTIAERAGLSARSLFRYFDDVDDLNRAAIEAQLALVQPLLRVDAHAADATDVKVERLAASRSELFEVMAPTARVARMVAPRHEVVAAQLAEGRAFWREQVRRLFAPELAAMGRAEADLALASADVLCSFESYELLRHDHGLTSAKATATMRHGLTALFAPTG